MKKAVACLALAAAFLALSDPYVRQSLTRTVRVAPERAGEDQPSFTEQLGGGERADTLQMTLYYRFADTALLGAERVQLDIRREETVATSVVQRLIDGPSVAHDRLKGLFPGGTRVVSVYGEGRTAFVTLSSEFLGRPEGAPADWEDLSAWQEEAALRRRLAVQSIVLSLTEDGRYQRVQLYIADSDDDIPERVPMAYFDLTVTDPALVLAASARDERAMLTPQQAIKLALSAWQASDWERLYQLLAPAADAALPAFSVFEGQMRELGVSLLSYETSAGTVAFDGQTATVVVDAAIRSISGEDARIEREAVPLVRQQDNWAIREDTLLSLMIRD